MVATKKTYSQYKPSDIERLGDIPSHWATVRLRSVADLRASNVDKLTNEHEIPVRLCNYTDVYKNLRIVNDMKFMRATAQPEEIAAFGLKVGDVIFTKDSEVFDDIGIPAVVESTSDDLICGYHLMLARPGPDLDGRYLAWFFTPQNTRWQFEVSANGVTRFGMPQSGFKDAWFSLPPLDEQRAIADYLDRKDDEITRFIESRRRMIALLEEKKQAIINQAVTKGLDPSVPMKDSGVEWLGEIPEHWEVRPNRFLMRPRRNLVGAAADDYTLLSLTLNGVIERDMVNPEGKFPTSFETYQEVKNGDFVLCLFDIEETPRCVGLSRFDGMITGAYDVLRPVDNDYSEFLYRYYLAIDQRKALKPAYRGLRNTIRIGRFLSFGAPFPPIDEMTAIIHHINEVSKQVDRAVQLHKREIELMQEYRTRLISDVVTGKVWV